MFDRFTDRARRVMGHARQAAQGFNHDYIGTEHILLGLLAERSGVAADVLHNLDVDPDDVRAATERRISPGTTMVTMGQLPFTPRGKRVLECSIEEATALGHSYLGTEHLLLGMLREEEGTAGRVLRDLNVRIEDARREILALVGTTGPDAQGRRLAEPSHKASRVALAALMLGPAAFLASPLVAAVEHALGALGYRSVRKWMVEADPGAVLNGIYECSLVVAFAGEAPPALVYALGAARALRRRVLLLTERGRALPAVLEGFRRVEVPGGAPSPAFVERLTHALERMQ